MSRRKSKKGKPLLTAGDEFLRLRMDAGFDSWPKLAAFLGVSDRSIRNWQVRGCPLVVEKMLRLLASDLSFMGQEWAGWRVIGGEFVEYHGAGYSVSPGEMRAFRHMESCIKHQGDTIKRLESELQAARAQLRFQEFLEVSTKLELPDASS